MSSSSCFQTCTTCNKTHADPDRQWNCHNVSGEEGPLCRKCEKNPKNVLNCALAGEYDCECFEYCSLYFELLNRFAPFAEESDGDLTKRIIKSATEDSREFHCEWTSVLIAELRAARESWSETCQCGNLMGGKVFYDEEEFDAHPDREPGYNADGEWQCKQCGEEDE